MSDCTRRCPERPRWRLGRFRARPWRCPGCGAWWVTKDSGIFHPDRDWQWVEVKGPDDEPEPAEMPPYDTSSTTAAHIERAGPQHIGFAAPEWPEDRR